eukprot:9034682-Pyramimonas_sp.AAC.1
MSLTSEWPTEARAATDMPAQLEVGDALLLWVQNSPESLFCPSNTRRTQGGGGAFPARGCS